MKDFTQQAMPLPPKQEDKKKIGWPAFGFGLFTLVVLAVLAVGSLLLPFSFFQPPKGIQVLGNRVLSEKELVSLLALEEDESWFGIDAYVLSQRLIQQPWVAEGLVHKAPGSRLHIWVRERQAMAFLRRGNEILLLGDERIILPYRNHPQGWDLPILTLPPNLKITPGDKLDAFYWSQLQRVLAALEQVEVIEPGSVSEILLTNPLNPILVTQPHGIRVILGDGDYPAKLDRLKRALPQINKRARNIRSVDLRNFQGPAITFE